jgi:hypothetical protein
MKFTEIYTIRNIMLNTHKNQYGQFVEGFDSLLTALQEHEVKTSENTVRIHTG